MRLIDRIFKLEEINGHGLCPTYLYRWTLFQLGWFKIYLHHFVADDWSLDLHDHPKRFTTIGLYGRYVEEFPGGEREWKAPWYRSFAACHSHRIRLEGGTCWTIAIVGKTTRAWGFWHKNKWIGWREYVGSEAAETMKACD